MKVHYEREIRLTHEIMSNRRVLVRQEYPRSPGLHISAILRKMGIAAKELTDSDRWDFPFDRMTNTHYPIMMALGVGWEEFRASTYTEEQLIWQPYELHRDQIYGTPDGLMPPQDDGITEFSRTWECKRTTKKLSSIREHWLYLKQGLSYAAMGASRFVQYDILYVDGNYQRPYQPAAMESLVEFEERELESWWKNVLRNTNGVKHE